MFSLTVCYIKLYSIASVEAESFILSYGTIRRRKNAVETARHSAQTELNSERDLRMLKLQQKIAGFFRKTEGVQTFCRVRSYLSSARKQGRNLLMALESASKGKPIALT